MARIKIEDLPVLEDLSAMEIKGIFGGVSVEQDDMDMAVTTEEVREAMSLGHVGKYMFRKGFGEGWAS